jgi:hypothetical protein
VITIARPAATLALMDEERLERAVTELELAVDRLRQRADRLAAGTVVHIADSLLLEATLRTVETLVRAATWSPRPAPPLRGN